MQRQRQDRELSLENVSLNVTRLDRAGIWMLIAVCILSLPAAWLSGLLDVGERDSRSALPYEDRLLSLSLTGLLVESDDRLFLPVSSVERVKRRLRRALKDKHVKGVLLRIDSPGGTVATSQELYGCLRDFRRKGVPLVASLADLAASGGYYVASACDRIVAQPGSITGSIGVIINSFNLSALEGKLGIEPQVIKSGRFKDMGSPNRPMTSQERDILQALIQDSYTQFVDAVAESRRLDREKLRLIADGRLYSGKQALALGLVDELGGYEAAAASLQRLVRQRYGFKRDLPLDEGLRGSPLANLLTALESRLTGASQPLGLLPESMSARFHRMPLWVMQ